jgi:ribosomal protein S18 acetylase RimI-like enzyme
VGDDGQVDLNDSGVQLRVGVHHDAERIAEYFHRCWLTEAASSFELGVAERLEPSMWLGLFRDRFSSESSMRTVVATHTGVVIGHVQVQGNNLVHLFIDPDHQGAGIGRRMLGIGEQLIVENGFLDAELHTRVGNERAVGLYTSAGWQLTDRLIHSVDVDGGIEYDEHVLVKQLDVADRRSPPP